MPNTVNRFFSVPLTGDLPGAWGTSALNPNFNALDGALGGVVTLSPSGATTITLSLPAGASFTPGAGPSQSENALIKFSGTLTGNAVIKFTMPGYYIVHNNCGSAASFSIQLSPASGVGNSIGAPPGRKAHVFFDGTDMDYVDMPEVGSALDLHTNTIGLPPWMNACTVKPYLVKDGTVFNTASYPALAQILGSTFGGNGITTFGVPDERARARVGLDVLSAVTGTYAGRLTVVGSGISGTTMAASGGSELVQTHSHALTDSGHRHFITNSDTGFAAGFDVTNANQVAGNANISGGATNAFNYSFRASSTDASVGRSSATTTGITMANFGTASSGNVMPIVISFLPLIKT